MGPLVDVTTCHGVPVVRLQGEFDIATVDALTRALDGITNALRPHLVVDLAEVTFLDCATIGVLVLSARTALTHGGCLVVACPDPRIAHVLALTTYSASWPVCATVDDAVDVARAQLVADQHEALGDGKPLLAPAENRLIRHLPAWLARHITGPA